VKICDRLPDELMAIIRSIGRDFAKKLIFPDRVQLTRVRSPYPK
jgi:hypothetical protein